MIANSRLMSTIILVQILQKKLQLLYSAVLFKESAPFPIKFRRAGGIL